MVLNNVGKMINQWWRKIPEKYENANLDIYQIMPNHFHGIIQIIETGRTHRSAPTLATMIQWFKTMTTNDYIRHVKNDGWHPFDGRLWQRNYYEHIIRTDEDLDKIRAYIQFNPKMWERDRNKPLDIKFA